MASGEVETPCAGADGLTCYAGMLYPITGSAYPCPTCKPEWQRITGAPVAGVETPAPGFCTILGQTCSHPECDEGRNCPKRAAERAKRHRDCGVETPEAARVKAIEVMAESIKRTPIYRDADAYRDTDYRKLAAWALDALIAQGWTPPGELEQVDAWSVHRKDSSAPPQIWPGNRPTFDDPDEWEVKPLYRVAGWTPPGTEQRT